MHFIREFLQSSALNILIHIFDKTASKQAEATINRKTERIAAHALPFVQNFAVVFHTLKKYIYTNCLKKTGKSNEAWFNIKDKPWFLRRIVQTEILIKPSAMRWTFDAEWVKTCLHFPLF